MSMTAIKAAPTPWVNDYGNVTMLARELIDAGIITTAEECQRFYEKPWKWAAEWQHGHGGHEYDPNRCLLCGMEG